jgi:transposase
VIVTAPDRLRQKLRGLPLGRLLDRCSRLRRSSAAADEVATRLVLRNLAHRAQAATVEADEFERELLAHVQALAPALLDEPGVGPVVAAQVIVAWSHHGRLRSEACFARLAGVAPVPASSGHTQRHRLSRGGTANSAARSTRSRYTADNMTPAPATTSPSASPKAKADATPHGCSSAT